MKNKLNIVLVGSGHAALALGLAFKNKHQVVQIVARNAKKAATVAKKIGCKNSGLIQNITSDADVYILCVKDDVIEAVSKKIPAGGVVLHLSGATSIKTLKKHSEAAVAWPVRSLAGVKPADWKHVHVLYEASNPRSRKTVESVFSAIGATLHYSPSEKRLGVHMSIVILNNFIHHLAFNGYTQLKKYGLEKALFKQIITDAFEKLISSDLKSTQTGPARRNDKKVIAAQLKLLKPHKELYSMYKTITQSIIKTYSHE